MKKLLTFLTLFLMLGGVASAISAETYLVCTSKKEKTHVVFDDSSGFEKYKLNKTYKQFNFDIINKTKHHIELKRDKSVSWKINRYTGEGTRKVGDYSFDYKCEKVDKLF